MGVYVATHWAVLFSWVHMWSLILLATGPLVFVCSLQGAQGAGRSVCKSAMLLSLGCFWRCTWRCKCVGLPLPVPCSQPCLFGEHCTPPLAMHILTPHSLSRRRAVVAGQRARGERAAPPGAAGRSGRLPAGGGGAVSREGHNPIALLMDGCIRVPAAWHASPSVRCHNRSDLLHCSVPAASSSTPSTSTSASPRPGTTSQSRVGARSLLCSAALPARSPLSYAALRCGACTIGCQASTLLAPLPQWGALCFLECCSQATHPSHPSSCPRSLHVRCGGPGAPALQRLAV